LEELQESQPIRVGARGTGEQKPVGQIHKWSIGYQVLQLHYHFPINQVPLGPTSLA